MEKYRLWLSQLKLMTKLNKSFLSIQNIRNYSNDFVSQRRAFNDLIDLFVFNSSWNSLWNIWKFIKRWRCNFTIDLISLMHQAAYLDPLIISWKLISRIAIELVILLNFILLKIDEYLCKYTLFRISNHSYKKNVFSRTVYPNLMIQKMVSFKC